jgi:hypothetical protein
MSKLAELLQSRGVPPATSATPATHQAESSKGSESSRQPLLNLSFTPALERRIRAMARRWQYATYELTDVLARARANPAGWERAVALDERREQEFRERGWLPRTDA